MGIGLGSSEMIAEIDLFVQFGCHTPAQRSKRCAERQENAILQLYRTVVLPFELPGKGGTQAKGIFTDRSIRGPGTGTIWIWEDHQLLKVIGDNARRDVVGADVVIGYIDTKEK